MSKSVHELAQVAGQVFESVIDESDVKHVFKVLHGFYGNLLLSKFATGRVVEKGAHKGEDEGIVNARAIWAHALRKHGPETIKVALARCQAAHPEFPPSAPQFVALCDASRPREVHMGPRAIGMSNELRSVYARRAREINAKHAARARAVATGERELPRTLDGLKLAIADAVSCAGGDEPATLTRLDRELAPRRPA